MESEEEQYKTTMIWMSRHQTEVNTHHPPKNQVNPPTKTESIQMPHTKTKIVSTPTAEPSQIRSATSKSSEFPLPTQVPYPFIRVNSIQISFGRHTETTRSISTPTVSGLNFDANKKFKSFYFDVHSESTSLLQHNNKSIFNADIHFQCRHHNQKESQNNEC